MAYARADLVTKTLNNLGIFVQTDTAAVRTRAELVTETRACLGLVQQADTSAPKTRVSLVAQAARILGVLPSGQTLSAEDSAIIDSKVDLVLADLNVRAVVTIANANAIPGGMFDAVAIILADFSKDAYELGGAATAQLTADVATAERKLRNFDSGAIIDEKLPSIMAELNARVVATVDLASIPSAWFSSLADIAAESCKGKFDLKPEIAAQLPIRAARAEAILKNLNRAFIVNRDLDAILSEIANDDLVNVVDDSDIPSDWFISLAAIAADRLKGNFELSTEVILRITADGAEAVNRLRRTTRGRPSYLQMIPEWI